jgi:hypothetical protein
MTVLLCKNDLTQPELHNVQIWALCALTCVSVGNEPTTALFRDHSRVISQILLLRHEAKVSLKWGKEILHSPQKSGYTPGSESIYP